MTTASFDVELAAKYGVNEAILFNYIQFWVRVNKYNKSQQHFIDDKYWTYQTQQAMLQLFPYWSLNTIKRTIYSLVEQKLIITAQHQKTRHNRTTWYTLTSEAWQLCDGSELQSDTPSQSEPEQPNSDARTAQNDTMDKPKMGCSDELKMGSSYNNCNNPVYPSVNNTPKSPKSNFDFTGFTSDEVDAINDWLAYKSERKQKYTPTGYKNLRKICVRLANHNILIRQIETSIGSNYQGIVEPKNLPAIEQETPPPLEMYAGYEEYIATKKAQGE